MALVRRSRLGADPEAPAGFFDAYHAMEAAALAAQATRPVYEGTADEVELQYLYEQQRNLEAATGSHFVGADGQPVSNAEGEAALREQATADLIAQWAPVVASGNVVGGMDAVLATYGPGGTSQTRDAGGLTSDPLRYQSYGQPTSPYVNPYVGSAGAADANALELSVRDLQANPPTIPYTGTLTNPVPSGPSYVTRPWVSGGGSLFADVNDGGGTMPPAGGNGSAWGGGDKGIAAPPSRVSPVLLAAGAAAAWFLLRGAGGSHR